MRFIQKAILGFIILLSLLGCPTSHSTPKESPETVVTLPEVVDSIELKKLRRKWEISAEELTDSLRLQKVLEQALEIAEEKMHSGDFQVEFESFPDSAFQVTTHIQQGKLFVMDTYHLIIHRFLRSTTDIVGSDIINIYLLKDGVYEQVLKHQQWDMEYTTYTIQDINGDNSKDLLVNWSPVSGCCLRNCYDVYLSLSRAELFSTTFHFINPTFSSEEQVIRGVAYGHPGHTELYKYQWKGLAVDTLEYIYFEKKVGGEKTRKIIRLVKGQEGVLEEVPEEYTSIYGYEWFLGNI